jgi:hypothetical protein
MLPPPGRGGRRSEGYVVEGGSGREISARASGGGAGRRDFVSRRVDGGTASPARAGERRAASWDFRAKIDEDGEGKNNEEGASGDVGGGVVCSEGAITIRPWSFRGRRSLEAVPTPRMYLEAARFPTRAHPEPGRQRRRCGCGSPGRRRGRRHEYDNDVRIS